MVAMDIDEVVGEGQVEDPLPGPDFEPAGPKPIKQLSNDVINQIAAAEIIHRPSNAIKELIENSLDAGSTSIKLTIKEGGLKLIQITDNGHGIHKADLPLLCTRYATSKLVEFEDLQKLQTYGFRGEALASISYCSHIEVITKTKDDGCGWRATYLDGELVPPKPGVNADPKPAAANDGTVISAEDLFYNMPLRKRAFKSPSEEYNRILDVIQKYAVHNPHAGWVCKKAGFALPDVFTPVASTTRANIGLLYTASLATDLLEVKETILKPEERMGAKVRGWLSSPNTNWARRGGWLFFINNRLVDSTKIKRAIDSLYTTFLAKGASPWVYLSLEIDPTKVDVNVHPTKSDVHFLNEDEVVEGIIAAVQAALAIANTSRSFTVQTLLPGTADPTEKRTESLKPAEPSSIRKPAPNYKVRMDPSNRTLDSMFALADPSQIASFTQTPMLDHDRPAKRRAVHNEEDGTDIDDDASIDVDDSEDDGIDAEGGTLWNPEQPESGNKEIPESTCEFTSIRELRKSARKKGNPDLEEILTKHAFVGVVDRHLCLSLIQHSTKLFLVNHAVLGDEHFYQLGLRQFGAFNRIRLDPAPSLKALLKIAADHETGIGENGMEVQDVVNGICDILHDKRDMMDEYFSLLISEDGLVETLPMALKGYTPNLDRLPHFLLCLGTQVDWTNEKECFHSFLRELAFFYSPRPFSDHPPSSAESNEREGGQEETEEDQEAWRGEKNGEEPADQVQHQLRQLEHVLLPSFRRYTAWPRDLFNRDVMQVANLPDLFRVFERC